MLTHEYSYETCLEGSVKNAWTVESASRAATSTSPSRSCPTGSRA